MNQVFQYTIPSLHPLAVHFPTALLMAAALVALVWMIRGRTFWRRALLLLLGLGFAGSVFAYLTGERLEEMQQFDQRHRVLLEQHEQMALATLIAAGIAALAMAGAFFYLERRTTIERDPADPLALRIPIGLLVLVCAALVAFTAHIGGVMVWALH